MLNHAAAMKMGDPLDSFDTLIRSAGNTGSFYSWAAGQITVVAWQHGLDETGGRARLR